MLASTAAKEAGSASSEPTKRAGSPQPRLGPVRVELLGQFNVTCDRVAFGGQDIWRRTHPRRLLQLIGSQRRASVARSEVLRALWPNLDETHSRNRLHHTLHLIRKLVDAEDARRYLVVLDGDMVSLAEGVVVDVSEFLALLDSDGSDAERLGNLLTAVSIYKGDLAADWSDDHAIESRRVNLRGRYLEALAEAAELSFDAGDVDQALMLLQRRVQADPIHTAAHVEYASMLMKVGRYDLAAAHCRAARQQVAEAVDAAAARPLDDLLTSIQRQSNRAAPGGVEEAAPVVSTAVVGANLQVSVPKLRLHGRETLIEDICRELDDPYHSVVTLCGPPGSGRSSVALRVAARMQSRLRDGAVHIPCGDALTEEALLDRLAAAICPLESEISPDLDALTRALSRREMLVLLDDVSVAQPIARLISTISEAARDCRFLVCAPRRLRLAAERAVRMDFLADVDEGSVAGDSSLRAALDVLIDQVRMVAPARRLDERYLAGLERIAVLVEGWPLGLVVVGRRLGWMQPPEVIAWLEKWHAATDSSDEPMEKAMIQWADGASEALPVLVKAASFEGWFTRADLAALLDRPPRSALDCFFDAAFETHLLKRRSLREAAGEVSEYRIPFLVRNWLRARSLRADWNLSRKRHALWLQWKVSLGGLDPSASRAAHLALMAANRQADIEAATRFLADSGEHELLQQIVHALLPGLRLAREVAVATTWITRAMESAQGTGPLRAQLQLERAGLYSRAGSIAKAYQDAEAAYRLASEHGIEQVKLRAAELLQSLGRESGLHFALPSSDARRQPLVAHGVEAGENLLRIARVSARFGEFGKAAELSSKAVDVFRYFNCTLGEIRALRYRGRMAFAMGNLDDVRQFAQAASRLACECDLPAESARAQLLIAEVALAQEDFGTAMRSAGRILSGVHGADPVIQVRAFKLLAWGHYMDGQAAVADMLQRELALRADAVGDPSHIANSHLLRGLLACDLHDAAHTHAVVSRLHSVLVASPGPFDVQSEWSEVAYLSARLSRPDTALGLLNALADFVGQPGHQLRPLTRTRVAGVQALLIPHTENGLSSATRLGTRDALAELIGGA